MKRILGILLIVVLGGCTDVSSVSRPQSYYQTENTEPAGQGDIALFSGGDALNDKEIARILDYRLKLPKQNRIAVMRLSSDSYWRFYSDDFTQLNDDIAKGFIGELRKSPRVYDASFLPTMLIPEKRTLPQLRQAAARFQADVLLAYRTRCRTFEKYSLIKTDVTRAYCAVEAVLLDVRSGIVPFTMVTTKEYSAGKQADDLNFQETVKKAELHAIAEALHDIGVGVAGFMNRVEQL